MSDKHNDNNSSVGLDDEYEAQLADLLKTTMGELTSRSNVGSSSSSNSASPKPLWSKQENIKIGPSQFKNMMGSNGEEELNPGKLGQRELSIPVPWGFIEAKTWGNSTVGKPILAVHGWMDNCGTFDKLIPLLPQSFYVVAIDVPGHGKSTHLPTGMTYHYIDFVTAIKRVVTYLQWGEKKKFTWLGHSMGGSLGFMFASLFPSMVDKLISLDLILPATDNTEDIPSKLTNGINAFLAMDTLEEKETKSPPCFTMDEAISRLMKFTLYSEYPLTQSAARTLLIRGTAPAPRYPGKVIFTRDQRLNTANFVKFSPEIMCSMLSQLRCHLLIIKVPSTLIPAGSVREKAIKIYNEKCSSFSLVEVPGNHFVHLNEPEVVNKIIGDFLCK